MKLNLGCGRETKEGFINVDIYERENKLDVIHDLTKEFPFDSDSCEYIYAEHIIEHFEWLDGISFLHECCRCLKGGKRIRLILPDYKKIFRKYLEGDSEFFEIFREALNGSDYEYYSSIHFNPEKVRKERVDNPPPDWHLSPRLKDRERVALRVRHYFTLIEIVHWFTHMYGEHKTLYDFESLTGVLKRVGFSKVYETGHKEIDMDHPSRRKSSLYVEAIK